MPKRRKTGPEPLNAVVPVGTTTEAPAVLASPPMLQEVLQVLTPTEEAFARNFVLCNNATKSYIEATKYAGKRAAARYAAWEMANRPHVLRRIREFESAAAAATVIDYAAILEHDRQIVEGFKHADQVMQHIWQCCRYCYGVEHKYQWIDAEEYYAALSTVAAENETRVARKLDEKPLPSDVGGYGFDVQADPNILCPRCEGRGTAVTVIADTTKLQGPARAIVKGVKVTSNGIEVLTHDVDKAKERLLRAGGLFKDDAASVARGAAAGAAAGTAAAIAASRAANEAKEMTAEEAQRLYLELA